MNGDPVLFKALARDGVPDYGFACPVCGRHDADQPDTLMPSLQEAGRARPPPLDPDAGKAVTTMRLSCDTCPATAEDVEASGTWFVFNDHDGRGNARCPSCLPDPSTPVDLTRL